MKDALFAFTIKFKCSEKHLNRRVEQLTERFEHQLPKTEVKKSFCCTTVYEGIYKATTSFKKESRISWQLSKTYCIPQLSMISALYLFP